MPAARSPARPGGFSAEIKREVGGGWGATAPGTLCRRSGDFPLGGRGAREEPASSVRGLGSRSSEHPARWLPSALLYQPGAQRPSRRVRGVVLPRFSRGRSPQTVHSEAARSAAPGVAPLPRDAAAPPSGRHRGASRGIC